MLNKQFLLLNTNYASYENLFLCNEFAIFGHIIITSQSHNFIILLTISIVECLPPKSLTVNLQTLLPYAQNGYYGLLIASASDFCGEHSLIDSVSKIIKLYDYDVAKNSQIHYI